jgi:4-amino-4-deoxy-L-arabinose transferase-like glycosyltransferase
MNNKKSKGIVLVVVVGVCVLMAFWHLGSKSIGNHEAYVGVVAREMIESGDWVVPVFNGEVRLQKTPLSYWLAATGAKIAGGVNDFIVRLPSAALAVLSAIAIFYFVCDCAGFGAGAFSALIWASSFCYIRYSHTGRPEMALTCFVATAMLSFYSAVKSQSRKKQIYCMLVFWISFALSMLAKGPAPLLLIFPALFFYFAVFRKWKLISKLLPIAGPILFLVVFLPWPIAIFLKQPGAVEVWKNEFFGRAAGEYASGEKPFYYYFGVMFVYLLPFSAFIPLALTAPFYRIWEENRQAIIYYWLWFVAGIVAMSLCGGKRQHYILPIIPAMAILAGIILDDMIFVRKAYSKKFAKNFIIANIVVIIVLAITATKFIDKGDEEDHNYVIQDFAHNVKVLAKGQDVIGYCKANASFIYYFGRDVDVVDDINDVYARYSAGGGVTATGDNFERIKKDNRFKLLFTGLDNGRGFFMKERINE